jgi:hypothetical protein
VPGGLLVGAIGDSKQIGYGYGCEKAIATRSTIAHGSAELDEHRDDSLEQLLASLMCFRGDELASKTAQAAIRS